jgi:nucleoside-diphosphate-sugar epimerase
VLLQGHRGALVVSGTGLVGGALVATLAAQGTPLAFTVRDSQRWAEERLAIYLDLLHPPIKLPGLAQHPRLAALWNTSPTVFLVAGVSGVINCERDPDTWRVNADAPAMLCCQARERGWPVVFLSTGAVEVAPRTAYAQQKAHAEAVVIATGGAVVRPRGRVDDQNKSKFAQFLIEASGRPGVHWWNE